MFCKLSISNSELVPVYLDLPLFCSHLQSVSVILPCDRIVQNSSVKEAYCGLHVADTEVVHLKFEVGLMTFII